MDRVEAESLFSAEQEDELWASRPDAFLSDDFEDYVSEVLPPSGEPLRIEVHKERAEEILGTLLAAYEANLPPYNQDRVRLPQDPRHMPETLPRGGIEHAMFFFNVCYYMRGGIKSNEAVIRMSRVYDAHPEMFDADYASEADQSEIEGILRQNGLGFQATVAGQWIENSKRLTERYGGDPRTIFEEVTDYDQALARIKNDGKGNGFVGFQEKMTSMIIYYLMDEGLIDQFKFPIPVDLHVLRVSIANELITFPNAPHGTNLFTKDTLAALRALYFNYAEEHGVNPLRLCDAVWMLSESSCGRHPGNSTIEPLGRDRRNGRSTILLPVKVDTHDPAQQRAYDSSCAICPLEETCQFNIPGTPYYVGGNIIIRGERVRFPRSAGGQVIQASLFD